MRCTALTLAPAVTASDAAVWRTSWIVMDGSSEVPVEGAGAASQRFSSASTASAGRRAAALASSRTARCCAPCSRCNPWPANYTHRAAAVERYGTEAAEVGWMLGTESSRIFTVLVEPSGCLRVMSN